MMRACRIANNCSFATTKKPSWDYFQYFSAHQGLSLVGMCGGRASQVNQSSLYPHVFSFVRPFPPEIRRKSFPVIVSMLSAMSNLWDIYYQVYTCIYWILVCGQHLIADVYSLPLSTCITSLILSFDSCRYLDETHTWTDADWPSLYICHWSIPSRVVFTEKKLKIKKNSTNTDGPFHQGASSRETNTLANKRIWAILFPHLFVWPINRKSKKRYGLRTCCFYSDRFEEVDSIYWM